MALVVDERRARANSRLSGIRLSMFTLRAMENWREVVDDCEKALILLAVSAITGERLTRGEELDVDWRDVRTVVPVDQLRQCNVSSVAAATGFNRETTRRKVNELIESGQLERAEDGRLGFKPGAMQGENTVDLMHRQLEAIVRVTNDLIRDGIILLEDDRTTPRP